MTRRLARLAVMPAVVGVIAGCSLISGPVAMGGGPDTSSGLCVSAPIGERLLVGDFIGVPEGVDVVVGKVDLLDADGIRVVQAWLAPPLDGAMGSSEYPPTPSPAWDARVLAEGAVAADGDNNVILLIERTGDVSGTAAAVQVEYSSGGIDYTVHGSMRIRMVDSCAEDPDDLV